jgi:hypothetical protein
VVASQRPLVLNFPIKAYSDYPFCYDKFQLRVQESYNPTWNVIWNGVTGLSGANPWQYADITLPAQTTGVSIFVNTAINTYCRWWAPGKFFYRFII